MPLSLAGLLEWLCSFGKLTGQVYIMSIKLATLSLTIINLSSTEKHLLTILCYKANKQDECWSSVELLEINTGLKRRTIEPTLKKLRDKRILIYTGRYIGEVGQLYKTPIYRINIDNGNFCRDKDLSTAIFAFDTGNFCIEMTAKIAVHKDNIKNNTKDNGFPLTLTSKNATTEQLQDIAYYKRNPQFPMPERLQEIEDQILIDEGISQ